MLIKGEPSGYLKSALLVDNAIVVALLWVFTIHRKVTTKNTVEWRRKSEAIHLNAILIGRMREENGKISRYNRMCCGK